MVSTAVSLEGAAASAAEGIAREEMAIAKEASNVERYARAQRALSAAKDQSAYAAKIGAESKNPHREACTNYAVVF